MEKISEIIQKDIEGTLVDSANDKYNPFSRALSINVYVNGEVTSHLGSTMPITDEIMKPENRHKLKHRIDQFIENLNQSCNIQIREKAYRHFDIKE